MLPTAMLVMLVIVMVLVVLVMLVMLVMLVIGVILVILVMLVVLVILVLVMLVVLVRPIVVKKTRREKVHRRNIKVEAVNKASKAKKPPQRRVRMGRALDKAG